MFADHDVDALATYTAATGATMDGATGLLSLTPEQFDNLQSLFFTIGEVSTIFALVQIARQNAHKTLE